MCKQRTSFTIKTLSTALVSTAIFITTGCQSTKSVNTVPTINGIVSSKPSTPARLDSFNIRGKIGVTTPQTQTQQAQSGSAFYAWAQEHERFTMTITGALGIGHTEIVFDGNRATLISERTGEISATDPEELLMKATGWHAPISQFPYWISGHIAPSDTNYELDEQGRLETSYNAGWTASFSYDNQSSQNILPSKIKVVHENGYRVIITISHLAF